MRRKNAETRVCSCVNIYIYIYIYICVCVCIIIFSFFFLDNEDIFKDHTKSSMHNNLVIICRANINNSII